MELKIIDRKKEKEKEPRIGIDEHYHIIISQNYKPLFSTCGTPPLG